jgi:hypothetical protein
LRLYRSKLKIGLRKWEIWTIILSETPQLHKERKLKKEIALH